MSELFKRLEQAMSETGISFSSCRVPYTYHHDFIRSIGLAASRGDAAALHCNDHELIIGTFAYLSRSSNAFEWGVVLSSGNPKYRNLQKIFVEAYEGVQFCSSDDDNPYLTTELSLAYLLLKLQGNK